MSTNQELRQISVRSVTGTTGTYSEDWIALFDSLSIPAGTFDERFIQYLQTKTSLATPNLPDLMAALAQANAVQMWSELGTFDPSVGPVTPQFPAITYNGTSDNMTWTGGPTGAAATQRACWAVVLTRTASGAEVIFETTGAAPVNASFKADNTPILAVDGGAIAAATAGTTVVPADGRVVLVFSVNGDHASVDVLKGTTLTRSTNVAGTAADMTLNSDWWFGRDAAGASFLSAEVHGFWAHLDFLGSGDLFFAEQFIDKSTSVPRDQGSDGSNPLGGVTQPIVSMQGNASNQLVNSGSGGNASSGSNSGDGTTGDYAVALTNAYDWLSATAASRKEADNSENTVATGFDKVANYIDGGADLAQAVVAKQPSRVDTAGVISALWDDVDDDLTAPADTGLQDLLAGGGYELFVLNINALADDWFQDGQSDGFPRMTSFQQSGGNVKMSFNVPYSGADLSFASTNFTIPIGEVVLLEFQGDTTGAAGVPEGTLVFSVNGADETEANGELTITSSPTATAADADDGEYRLGNNAGGTRTANMSYYADVKSQTIPAAGVQNRIRQHYSQKYGFTLASVAWALSSTVTWQIADGISWIAGQA